MLADPIDHCEGRALMATEESKQEFLSHPARAWFRDFVGKGNGVLVDVTRKLHPQRAQMFTCWNTVIDARPANYGTRLDYTLVSAGLEQWVKDADIWPLVYGSDHCPVTLDLHESLTDASGHELRLVDEMHGLSGTKPIYDVPRLAASRLDEFCTRKQPRLQSMFSGAKAKNPDISPSPSQGQVSETPPLTGVNALQDTDAGAEAAKSVASAKERSASPSKTALPSASAPPKLGKGKEKAAQNGKGRQASLASFFGERDARKSPPLTDSKAAVAPYSAAKRTVSDLDIGERPDKSARVEATEKWTSIFTPLPPPLCSVHKEPARSWTVNKPGINHKRKFWLCARPVGPGYEGSKAPKVKHDAESAQYRCDYFSWDSDVKRDAKRRHNAGTNGSRHA